MSQDNHKPVHVLYVEDDVGLARLFQKKLERVGYVVDLVYDGESGLAQITQQTYDVVALDFKLPGQDGLEIMHKLLDMPHPPIIMITGTGNEQTAVEAMKLGASDYIVKDPDGSYLDLMPSTIQQVLLRQQLVIERAQAVAALQKRNQKLALLNEAGQALTSIFDLDQIMSRLLQALIDLTDAAGSSVWLWVPMRQDLLECRAVFHYRRTPPLQGIQVHVGEGVAGWVAQHNQPAIVPDAAADPRFAHRIDHNTGFQTHSIMAVPLRLGDGLIGVIEVVNKREGEFDTDDLAFTQTLAASAAIAIHNASLVEALHQRTQDLEARKNELDAFAHTVAHDLQNPLSLITGYAEMLVETEFVLTEAEKEKSLNHILENTRKMSNIIEELLLLATVRREDIAVAPVDMARTVKEARRRLSHMIEKSRATLTAPSTWPLAMGYAPWVEAAWVNYLSNALRYGGDPPIIEIGSVPEGEGMIRFWVRDKGPGIPLEQQARLFQPFEQVNKIRAKGHGLGLSIVRRIIEKLGGQVGLESEVGQGSTFWFILPKAEEDDI
jgi:signal transduction histidine kinase